MRYRGSPTLWLSILAVATAGCWQEIHYDPSSEPIATLPTPTRYEESQPAEVMPEEESAPIETSPPAITEPAPPKPVAEQPDPIWEELDAEETVEPKPAPADDLDWLDDEPAEAKPAVPLAAAWKLGSKWSLAVGIYGKGYGSDRFASMLEQAEAAADELAVSVPPLPVGSSDELSRALETLQETAGPELVRTVGRSHSRQHEALCELAINTHALLLEYSPRGRGVDVTVDSIRELARTAELPERLWQGVVDALERRASFQEVKAAVLALHREAASYLESL